MTAALPTTPAVPERTVRVLIACDHIDYDGAMHGGGRQLVELTRALQGSSIEPIVCVLRRATRLGHELQAEGLPLRFLGDGRFSPVTLPRLVAMIHDLDVHVLHLTDFGASTFGRLAGWMTRTPTIVQVISHHSQHQARGFPWYVEWAYKACAPLTSHALAISDSVKDFSVQHMGFDAAAVEVLHYPLPRHSFSPPAPERVRKLRRRYGIADADPVIGAVTRFYPSKGIRYLLQAFRPILDVVPNAWLVLVGQGPEEARLRRQAHELGVAHRVIFAGFQREAHTFVRLFRVAAVPSLEEGFGLVALESQALGVPVVASDIGGLRDIVTHESSGLLVEAQNASALAHALLRVLGDDTLHRRLSATGERDAQRFSLDRYVTRLSEIYRTLARREEQRT